MGAFISSKSSLEGNFMWVITAYSNSKITMFEFDTEEEARKALKKIQGCKILSEIVYFNDPNFVLVMN
jgi:tellurite resistance protein